MNNLTKVVALSAFASFLIVGCGGGGGSSEPKLTFNNAKEAPANKETGKETTDSLVAQLSTNGSLSGLAQLGKKTKLERKAKFTALELAKKARHVSRKFECESGYVKFDGDGDDSGGTATEDFHNCKLNGATINGKVKVTFKAQNGDMTYVKLNIMTNLTTKAAGLSETLYAGSTIEFTNIKDNSMDETSTIKIKINDDTYGQKNAKWHYSFGYDDTSAYQTQGEVYFKNATEYVTYDKSYNMKNTPIKYDESHVYSGEAHYIAKNKDKIILKVIDVDTIEIDIDKKGDGTIDETATYNLK